LTATAVTGEERLGTYGWSRRTEALFAAHAAAGLVPGRVLVEHRGSYVVATPEEDVEAVVSGRFRHDADTAQDYPAVGDWVALGARSDGSPTIHAVLPRASRFARQARGDAAEAQIVAANVDLVFVVAALDHDFNLRRLERYVALAWSSGAEPVIVLNKADTCADVAGRISDAALVAPGVPIRAVSALEGDGIDSLAPLLEPGKTVALLGSSGVGKSTLTNALLGWQRQQTNSVRADDQRGRHTTTVRELMLTPSGALLIDSPGMRSVGMWEVEQGLGDAFSDVEAFAAECRFSDCTHVLEPGCAVKAAISRGELAAERLASRDKLARESAALARRVNPISRAEERRKWKLIQKSTRDHMRTKYGPESA
jgi:ribosome biogenesis GTPase